MALAKVLCQASGHLPIAATGHDYPSSSANPTSLLHSKAKDANDTVLALLVWLADGFDIDPGTKLSTAIEVMRDHTNADNTFNATCDDMEVLAGVLNIMMNDKEGLLKDPKNTLEVMRQCERARHAVLGTTRMLATNELHLHEGNVSACHKQFALDYLQNHLLPHQEHDPTYAIKWKDDGTWRFTGPQRSFINSELRKNLGHPKVAFRIWELGLPLLASTFVQGKSNTYMLHSCMSDCLDWFLCLAKDLVKRTAHPHYQAEVDRSSKTPSDAEILRREELQQARQKLKKAKRIATFCHSKKRNYDEMSPSEQQLWEDFHTGKCLEDVRANQHNYFLGKFRSSSE